MVNKEAKLYAEHLVSKHMSYIKKSIKNGDAIVGNKTVIKG